MKLPDVIKALNDEMPHRATWTVAVLTRKRSDGSLSEEIIQYPIFDVSIDHDGTEINLLTDEDSQSPRAASEALTLAQLYDQLRQLENGCSDYSVYSSSAFVPLDDEYDGRMDIPLVGVARNIQEEVFGFLQFPPDQWEATE